MGLKMGLKSVGLKMGLKSVTTEQGVSVTPHSSFILDWAMHTTGGMEDQLLLPQSSTKLLNIWLIL